MLSINDREKVRGFVLDKAMVNAVKTVLQEVFMKPQKGDVQTLAAQMLAIGFLDEGFKELNKFSNEEKKEAPNEGNIGM